MPKILNPATLPIYASAPSSPALGDMYFNSTDDASYIYTTISGVNTWSKLGGKVKVQVYDTPGSYTWTRPENVQWLKAVVVVGAGGGGGAGAFRAAGGTVASGGGGGGGGGAFVIAYDIYVGNISSISVSVPSGGSGGAGGTFTKAAGSTTTFSGSAVSGSAGSGNATFGSYISCPSGSGGTAGAGSSGPTGTASSAAGGTAASAPTVTGLYAYVSGAGGAGGTGAAVTVAGTGVAGSSGGYSAASYAADGTSSNRQGQNRIQWSSSLLTAGGNGVNTSASQSTNPVWGTVTGASSTFGNSTSYGIGNGGVGGGSASANSTTATVTGINVVGGQADPTSAIMAYTNNTQAASLTINGGTSQRGGNYGNGGAGGSGLAVGAAGGTSYNPHSLDLTAGSGGNGASGFVSIAWIE